MTAPSVARRVVARAGVGLWRQRGGLLIGLAIIAGVTGYMALGSSLPSPTAAAAGTSTSPAASTDCADTAMAAIANKSSGAAQQAYQCMDPAFQQRVPEETFVQQMQTQTPADVNSVARVGDYHTQAGGSMVYYAVNANGQSVGYIVYLGQDGKVLKIE
ncbi:MAG: hypothetical protein JO057_03750 [Chloroflexi bacterium]|nr:hypothetical protein [Chloroflexota bacterium]